MIRAALLLPFRLLAWLGSTVMGALALLLLLEIAPLGRTLELEGLLAPVEILWDGHGIPTIRAANDRDAWFALGFVHARDRLWQMELRRRAARGRLAEILGPEALPSDRLLRTLGLAWRAERSLAAWTPEDRDRLAAYVAGINAAIDLRPLRPLPFLLLDVRPEHWQASDPIAIQKLFAFDLEDEWRAEMQRAQLLARLGPELFADLFPEAAADELATISDERRAFLDGVAERSAALLARLPQPGRGASNAWAVSGSRTVTGSPLLANDPHLPLEWPVAWYLARIETPAFAVSGGTLPGLPAVVVGHNRDLAWGLTTTHADTQDVIGIEVTPDGASYVTANGREPLVVRVERILVRGGQTEWLRVRETRFGPLVSDLAPGSADSDRGFALAWTALATDDTTLAFGLRLPHARSGEDLVQAARSFVAPAHNLTWASVSGHIGFRVLGRIPRRHGRDGLLPTAATDPSAAWNDVLDPADLPAIEDPPAGFSVNANNRPLAGPAGDRIARLFPDDLRARRITALLTAAGKADLVTHARIQNDIRSNLADVLLPHLGSVAFSDPRLERLREALLLWDREMRTDRFEPALFAAWSREVAATLYADELGPLFDAWRHQPRLLLRILRSRPIWCDDRRTAELEDCASRLALAFARAVAALEQRTGRPVEELSWGELHQARLADPVLGEVPGLSGLFALRAAVPGDRTTVNVAAWMEDRPFEVRFAAGLRMLVALDRPPRSLWVIAGGQSGSPLSPHARDMLPHWQSGGYLRIGVCELEPPKKCHRTWLHPASISTSR
ncbi:Acyl-homoserine lactone acylase QuiP [bacterium HR40]|nr:Acyl-homoserine lactone acylase QuiP [bacterium HR40]